MDYARQSRMRSCFNGTIERNCGTCIAHPDNGGKCCYGEKFDPEDPECIDCVHCGDCEEECYQPDYRMARRSRVKIRSRRDRSIAREPDVVSIEKRANADSRILHRLCKEFIWGMGVGGFKSLYEYMSRNRWP